MKKIAIVDTNVLVSGIFWKGPPYLVLKSWIEGGFKLVVSPDILKEYQRVLEEVSKKYPEIAIGPILEVIELNCEMMEAKPVRGICRDPDDDKFIAAAISSGADFIVSGDKDLLELGTYQNVRLVKPSVFLKEL